MTVAKADAIVIGGGFYGCCLALYLRSVCDRVVIIEREQDLFQHASQVNQARVHTGFHYPRSFVTALRAHALRQRFSRDFAPAIVDNFRMLYAIARRRSKVTKGRFLRMFEDMGAPIHPASPADGALFDERLIDGVFACEEAAFDWSVLRSLLTERLAKSGVDLRLGVSAVQVQPQGDDWAVALEAGESLSAPIVFNVTYSGINRILLDSGFAPVGIKHEVTEIALVTPPEELTGRAVTVMDGPFFSVMPFPSAGHYSLTHVRYTPHRAFVDGEASAHPYDMVEAPPKSAWRHMVLDAARYLPSLERCRYERSMFDIKSVLVKSERDDGRPILLSRHGDRGFYSVMGAKIDNIYDLFDLLPSLDERFTKADTSALVGGG